MSFDKKRIAAVSAIAAAVAVAAGGYCVSLANYSSTLEKARVGIEQYITKSANLEPGKVSVAFFEPDSALFSHKVTLVVTDGEDSFKLPMSITSGYASYTFDLDIINATVNRENALAHFDLTELTKIEARGKLNLISGQLSFTSDASFLNDAKFLRDHAFATAFDNFQKQKSQEAQAQAQKVAAAAAAKEVNESEQVASDAQEIASVDTIKDTPVTADLDTAGAAAEAQANNSEQVAITELPETEVSAEQAQETNESEQVASDAQEIASVDTIKDTPVTADLDTAGAAAEAEAQANNKEQVTITELPETEVSAEQAQETNESEQVASDAQEIASVDTIKDTPVTADLDTAGAAAEAEAQANNNEQVTITELPETEVSAEQAQETNESNTSTVEVAETNENQDNSTTVIADESQETDGLTNLKEMVAKAEADKNEAKLAQMAKDEFQQLVKKVGFKEVGNLSISVSIDRDENVKSSVSIDSFHRNGMGLTNLNVYGENKGLLAIKSVGRSEIALASIYEISYNGLSDFKDIVMKLNSPYTSKNGNFNLDYIFKLCDYNGYKNIEASGSLNGLNIGIFNSEDSIGALAKSIERNGLELTFNKGSKFSIDSKARADKYSDVQEREVTVNFAGKLALPKGEPFNLFFSIPQGEVDFNLDLDARNLADPEFIYDEDIIKGFDVKDGKSYGKLVVTKERGMPSVLINGQDIFLK